jgi:hypothetical protein
VKSVTANGFWIEVIIPTVLERFGIKTVRRIYDQESMLRKQVHIAAVVHRCVVHLRHRAIEDQQVRLLGG